MKLIEKLVGALRDIERSNHNTGRDDMLENKLEKREIREIKSLITISLVKNGKPIKKNVEVLVSNGFQLKPKDVDIMGWHSATITTSKGYIEFELKGDNHAVVFRKPERLRML